jgi:hypothetical protein
MPRRRHLCVRRCPLGSEERICYLPHICHEGRPRGARHRRGRCRCNEFRGVARRNGWTMERQLPCERTWEWPRGRIHYGRGANLLNRFFLTILDRMMRNRHHGEMAHTVPPRCVRAQVATFSRQRQPTPSEMTLFSYVG